MSKTSWSGVLQISVLLIVATACSCVVNLAVANDPSADDVFRGGLSGLTGIIIGAGLSHVRSLFGKVTRMEDD